MARPDDGAAMPLRVQAAAAASLLLDGHPPEDIGKAAAMANPEAGEWAPRQMATLLDAMMRILSDETPSAGDGIIADDARDDDDAGGGIVGIGGGDGDQSGCGWWDPEALARVLVAMCGDDARGARTTRISRDRDGGGGEPLPPRDVATLAHVLVVDMAWSPASAGDLLWCLHAAQATTSGPGVAPERVEDAADVILELSRARAIRGGGCGWSKEDATALLPRLLPKRDWDARGLAGLSAVGGCALFAAALAAGGRRAVTSDGGGGGGGGAGTTRRRDGDGGEYPTTRGEDGEGGSGGWGVADVAMALRAMLEEEDDDEEDDEEEEETRAAVSRATLDDASTSAPTLGPARDARLPRKGGWTAAAIARVAAELTARYGWDDGPAAALVIETLGWEASTPDAAADAAHVARAGDDGARVRWSHARCAALLLRMHGDAEEELDVAGFVSPVAHRLASAWGWRPSDVVKVLEELAAWDADSAAALVGRLPTCDPPTWSDDAIATLLSGLMRWRGRERADAAVVAVALRRRDPRWNGGGVLGDVLDVAEGGVDDLVREVASIQVAEVIEDEGEGGEGFFRWPPEPPVEVAVVDDGYSADAE